MTERITIGLALFLVGLPEHCRAAMALDTGDRGAAYWFLPVVIAGWRCFSKKPVIRRQSAAKSGAKASSVVLEADRGKISCG